MIGSWPSRSYSLSIEGDAAALLSRNKTFHLVECVEIGHFFVNAAARQGRRMHLTQRRFAPELTQDKHVDARQKAHGTHGEAVF